MINVRRSAAALVVLAMSSTGAFVACSTGAGVGSAVPIEEPDASVSDAEVDADAADAVDAEGGLGPLPAGRPSATPCTPRIRDAGNAGEAGFKLAPDASDTCTADGECDAGRCAAPLCNGDSLGARCTYDACMQDSDCGGSAVCACDLGFASQNVCLSRGNCRTNADCAQGQVCALSRAFTLMTADGRVCSYNAPISSGTETGEGIGNAGARLGYFCTTPDDECRPKPYDGAHEPCNFFPDRNHWAWEGIP